MKYALIILLLWLAVMLICMWNIGYNMGQTKVLRGETKDVLNHWKQTIKHLQESTEMQNQIIEGLEEELKLCKNLVQLPDERTTIED